MRISEIYPAVEGEGPNVGKPVQIVRFAGCNLRCPGWPCDSMHSVDPKHHRASWQNMSPERIISHLKFAPQLINLSGGEPWLQPEDEMYDLVKRLWESAYTVESFTNGTQRLPSWAIGGVQFIMDWKLPGSGEDPQDSTRVRNLMHLTPNDCVKFVVKDRSDFDYAVKLYTEYQNLCAIENWFVSPVWGTDPKLLVSWVLQGHAPFRLSIQTHNYIYDGDNLKRGI